MGKSSVGQSKTVVDTRRLYPSFTRLLSLGSSALSIGAILTNSEESGFYLT